MTETITSTMRAEPFDLKFNLTTTALIIIDMQRDFVLPGGFGEKLGNDPSLLLAAVEPTQRVLAKAQGAIFGWVSNADNFIKALS